MDEEARKRAAKAKRRAHRLEKKRIRKLEYEQFVKSFKASVFIEADAQELTPKDRIKKPSVTTYPKCNNVSSNSFLMSYEWRKIRMMAIKKYGNKCQCCGATPKDGIKINVDHIKPRKLYPHLALDINNLQILCDVCNHGKGNWDKTDWR